MCCRVYIYYYMHYRFTCVLCSQGFCNNTITRLLHVQQYVAGTWRSGCLERLRDERARRSQSAAIYVQYSKRVQLCITTLCYLFALCLLRLYVHIQYEQYTHITLDIRQRYIITQVVQIVEREYLHVTHNTYYTVYLNLNFKFNHRYIRSCMLTTYYVLIVINYVLAYVLIVYITHLPRCNKVDKLFLRKIQQM